MYSIETLLSARLFLVPQQWGTRLFFVSNLGQGGHLSLYAMERGGSVLEPLLPPHIALQNPSLLESDVFAVFPSLGKILVILDQDGDENYQPMLISLEGGLPEPAFGDRFVGYRLRCLKSDPARNLAYLHAESTQTLLHEAYQANLESDTLLKLGESTWENAVMGFNARHTRVTLLDVYGAGDDVLYEWRAEDQQRHLLLGTPIEQRVPDQVIPPRGALYGANSSPKGTKDITSDKVHLIGLLISRKRSTPNRSLQRESPHRGNPRPECTVYSSDSPG